MRILDFYDVAFKGKPSHTVNRHTYTIQQDDGKCFDVKIPDITHINTAFRWMSDNDCLRYLRSVEPTFTDNQSEIEMIMDQNSRMEEHAYLTGSVIKNYSSAGIHQYVPGLIPVPAYEYICTWSFFSKEHAVMFKLACGGDQPGNN